jgi:hypothetical protein
VRAKPREFLSAIDGFRDDLVVGAECMFNWYWLADLCLDEKISFLLGHALYMLAGPGQMTVATGHCNSLYARLGRRADERPLVPPRRRF